MNITNIDFIAIFRIIFGLGLFLFIPGYFLTKIFFNKSKRLELILLSLMFSIMSGLTIGIFFGYDRAQALKTGGFTFNNLFIAELVLTLLLMIIFYIQQRVNDKKSK